MKKNSNENIKKRLKESVREKFGFWKKVLCYSFFPPIEESDDELDDDSNKEKVTIRYPFNKNNRPKG